MPQLVKLGILGIRSFSPAGDEVLEFQKPLTLIVGHNGAGKTTIVECLKMVSCGELPPFAAKGKSFVHDPQVAEQAEVKAQIRLSFTTLNSMRYTATRNFMVTSSKMAGRQRQATAKISFKALDSVLTCVDLRTDQKSSTPYRTSDLDKQLPSLLGLSKALIENVIFVHQEDSNWPLADQGTLKKRFDEIFGSDRYTKALENISSVRKVQAKNLKEAEHTLALVATTLDEAQRIEQRIGVIHHEMEELNRNKQLLEAQLITQDRLLEEETRSLRALAEVENVLEYKRHLLNEKRRQRDQAEAQLNVICSESLEELRSLKVQVDEDLQSLRTQEERAQAEVVALELRNDEAARVTRDQERSKRALMLAKERLAEAEMERKSLLLRLSKGGVRLDPHGNVIEQIMKERRAVEASVCKEKQQAQRDLDCASRNAEAARERAQGVQVRLQCLMKDAASLATRRSKLEADVARLRQAEQSVGKLATPANDELASLEREIVSLDGRTAKARDCREQLESELEEATAELRSAEKEHTGRLRLSVVEDNCQRLATALRRLVHRAQRATDDAVVPDENWEPKRVDFHELAKKRSTAEKQRSVLESKVKETNQSLGAIEASISELRSRISNNRHRIQSLAVDIQGFEDDTNEILAERIAERRHAADSILKDLLVNKNAESLFKSFLASEATRQV